MQTISQLVPLRSAVDALKVDGPLALVPTMGALHEGHLTLVREARRQAAHVAVSIFVNPRQFGANEDLAAYPRQLARDSALLEGEGVDLIWAPPVPKGASCWVQTGCRRRSAGCSNHPPASSKSVFPSPFTSPTPSPCVKRAHPPFMEMGCHFHGFAASAGSGEM